MSEMETTKSRKVVKKTVTLLSLLLVAVVLTFSLPSAGFSEQNEQKKTEKKESKKESKKTGKKEMSKEETFAYIKERCTVDNDNVPTNDNVFLEGCMFISETKSYDGTYTHRRYAPLDLLNPDSPTPGLWPSTNGVKFGLIPNSVSYTTSDEKGHIKFTVVNTTNNFNHEDLQSYGYFQCESETAAKQVAKALKHLIKLCGGKLPPEPFD